MSDTKPKTIHQVEVPLIENCGIYFTTDGGTAQAEGRKYETAALPGGGMVIKSLTTGTHYAFEGQSLAAAVHAFELAQEQEDRETEAVIDKALDDMLEKDLETRLAMQEGRMEALNKDSQPEEEVQVFEQDATILSVDANRGWVTIAYRGEDRIIDLTIRDTGVGVKILQDVGSGHRIPIDGQLLIEGRGEFFVSL